MDNAGENQSFTEWMKRESWKLNIEVELMACNTPQQNSVVEVAIVTMMNHVCAMMHCANLLLAILYCAWHDMCKMAKLFTSLVIVEKNRKTCMF